MEKPFLCWRDLCHIRGMLSRKVLAFKRSLKAAYIYIYDKQFTLADKRDIFLMQEQLKRRLYRWARLIRRQPGLEGLENQHEKKMTEISKSGIFPTL